MLSLHAAAAAAGSGDGTASDKISSHDPLCLNNASLHALQNLRPWVEDSSGSVAQRSGRDSDAISDDDDDDVVDGHDDVSDVNRHQRYDDLSPAPPATVRLQPVSRPLQLHQPYLTAA